MSDGSDGQRAGLVGGRFSGPPAEEMARFSSSLAVDLRMLDEDVDGSLAHVTMLGEVGILTIEEAERLREGPRAGALRDPLGPLSCRPMPMKTCTWRSDSGSPS